MASLNKEAELPNVFDIDIAGIDMIFLGCEFVFYFALLFTIEKIALNANIYRFITKE